MNNNLDIKICSWNIKGLLNYKDIHDFKQYCNKFDIIGLVETWASSSNEFDNFLEGYFNFHYIRPKKPLVIRGSGGVSVFVKNSFIKNGMIGRIFEKFPEYVVLKLDGNYLSLSYDIILYFVYVAPEGSPIYNNEDADGIDLVSDRLNQIVLEYPNAAIMLAGDFNARIKDFLDYIPNDNLQYIFGNDVEYPADEFNMARNTKDTVYNNYGLSLIYLCCIFDVHVLNGRLFDDLPGKFTCTANNGTSIVDYVVASSCLFKFFTSFGVHVVDWSVHFPLYCNIAVSCNAPVRDQPNEILSPWYNYKWKPESREEYIDHF